MSQLLTQRAYGTFCRIARPQAIQNSPARMRAVGAPHMGYRCSWHVVLLLYPSSVISSSVVLSSVQAPLQCICSSSARSHQPQLSSLRRERSASWPATAQPMPPPHTVCCTSESRQLGTPFPVSLPFVLCSATPITTASKRLLGSVGACSCTRRPKAGSVT